MFLSKSAKKRDQCFFLKSANKRDQCFFLKSANKRNQCSYTNKRPKIETVSRVMKTEIVKFSRPSNAKVNPNPKTAIHNVLHINLQVLLIRMNKHEAVIIKSETVIVRHLATVLRIRSEPATYLPDPEFLI